MDPARTDVYYLPHSDVFDPLRDTTKLRVVFDASATTGTGKSLKDCLLPGPPLQQKVAAIVMRFRTKQIALIGDCQKMFLQVGIEEADRDFIRFLWKDPDDPDGKVQIFRFTKLIFGATDSPFQAISCLQRLVRNKLKEKHLTALEKRVCDTIKKIRMLTISPRGEIPSRILSNCIKDLRDCWTRPSLRYISGRPTLQKSFDRFQRRKRLR